jgi:hypothetical protein
MSALGHSLQRNSASVLANVRYASDSDHSRHGSELTRSANSRHSASAEVAIG